MRMLVDVNLPLEPFNSLVKDGTVGQKIQQILEDIKPEAVYFREWGGKRGAILIVDIADPSKVPSVAEPFFLTFNASVEFHVVISPEELAQSGLEALGQKYG